MWLIPIADVETSGLHHEEDILLEIAILLVDENLEEIDRFSSVIHYTPGYISDVMAKCDEFVLDMHIDNNLWNEACCTCEPGTCQYNVGVVDQRLADWLADKKGEGDQFRTMGNSLRLDLNFIEEYLPKTYDTLGYRSVDMSAVEFFVKLIGGGDYPEYEKHPTTAHRAMADNEQCLAQARAVRNWIGTLLTENVDLKFIQSQMGH